MTAATLTKPIFKLYFPWDAQMRYFYIMYLQAWRMAGVFTRQSHRPKGYTFMTETRETETFQKTCWDRPQTILTTSNTYRHIA